MPASPPLPPRSALVSRLRMAGCVYAEEEADLLLAAAATPAKLAAMVDRRVAGLPLEQVLGWAEFCGLRIAVEPGVFVPRRRTEFLVAQAIAVIGHRTDSPVVVDLCCGSGAVGAALAATVGAIELYAVDIDPAAVRCARCNLATSGAQVYRGDLYAPLPADLRGRVDLLVANAPYVPSEAIALMPPEARLHEPDVALNGGADGLSVLTRVVAEAPQWLGPGAVLLVEAGAGQIPGLKRTIGRHGLTVRVARSRRLHATVVRATAPAR